MDNFKFWSNMFFAFCFVSLSLGQPRPWNIDPYGFDVSFGFPLLQVFQAGFGREQKQRPPVRTTQHTW